MFKFCDPWSQAARDDTEDEDDNLALTKGAQATVTDASSLSTSSTPPGSPSRGVPRSVAFESSSIEEENTEKPLVSSSKGMFFLRGMFLMGILLFAVIVPFVDVKTMLPAAKAVDSTPQQKMDVAAKPKLFSKKIWKRKQA